MNDIYIDIDKGYKVDGKSDCCNADVICKTNYKPSIFSVHLIPVGTYYVCDKCKLVCNGS